MTKADLQSLRICMGLTHSGSCHRTQDKAPEGLKQIEQRAWDKLPGSSQVKENPVGPGLLAGLGLGCSFSRQGLHSH